MAKRRKKTTRVKKTMKTAGPKSRQQITDKREAKKAVVLGT